MALPRPRTTSMTASQVCSLPMTRHHSNVTKSATLDGPRRAPTQGPARQLVVFLHGYGADGHDLIGLGEAWAEVLPHAAFVSPHAPEASPYGSGRQWFALSTGFVRSAEDVVRDLRAGVPGAAAAVDAFVDAELARLSLDNDALALVGFSQGASLALYAGLLQPARAVAAYSGALAVLPSALPASKPRVLLHHGARDDIVPAAALNDAAKTLRASDVDVRTRMVPMLGHGIDPEGVALGAKFLAESFA
jgi:phospholipase/carboxylesterase